MVRCPILFSALLLALGLARGAAADWAAAAQAYDGGDYETALSELTPLAEAGDAEAQVQVAWILDQGLGVSRDPVAAVRWYRRAAEAGLAGAQYQLALKYDSGSGVPRDHQTAAAWYRRAAQEGHSLAQNNLAVLYQGGRGVPRDMEQALHWYRRAAEQGYAGAQHNLATLHERRGAAETALVWYLVAAARGHRMAVARAEDLSARLPADAVVHARERADATLARQP